MPSYDKLEQTPRKELDVFYVLDTSGSMTGEKIASLNHAMEECIRALADEVSSQADADIRIAILEFNSRSKWVTSFGPVKAEDFIFEPFTKPGGLTNIGDALRELEKKLHKHEFMSASTGSLMPIIIFMTDGEATGQYKRELEKIRNNRWFQNAIKIGFAVGDDADSTMIANLVGNREAVIKTSDLDLFSQLLQFVTVTSSMVASKSSVSQDDTSSTSIVEEVLDDQGVNPEDVIPSVQDIRQDEFIPEPDPAPFNPDDPFGSDEW